jgi:UPF0176 protein
MEYVVAALYKFAPLADLPALKAGLEVVCRENGIRGILLLAHEGINGTVSGARAGIDALARHIRALPGLADLEYKESFAGAQPFHRMKVRLKKEIVTIGLPGVNPNTVAGTYADPEGWNALIEDPDTLVIDTRNGYEVKIGTFKNAVDPQTKSFSEFPAWVEKNLKDQKHRKVAMFCTGGIRCEKASSYMKSAGFEQVYHLKGGILKYLEAVPAERSLWDGACFVFDQRVAVEHGLKVSDYTLCPTCRMPVGPADRTSPLYTEGVACPACHASATADRKARSAERHKQVRLAEKRGVRHIGQRQDQV